jgi:hypothetical protein
MLNRIGGQDTMSPVVWSAPWSEPSGSGGGTCSRSSWRSGAAPGVCLGPQATGPGLSSGTLSMPGGESPDGLARAATESPECAARP